MFKTVWKSQLLGNSVKVGDRQFPRIHALAKQCADTLHIATPQVYASRVKDRAEVDGDRERQHEGGRALREKQDRCHSTPRKARRSTARLRPAIE